MALVDLGLPGVRGSLPPDVPSGLPDLPDLPRDRPATTGLVDRFGRVATDLRVSLTDRCTLRCGYCMPPEGLDWLPSDELLSDDEVIRLVSIAVRDLGITSVRFTGGEPLLRQGISHIVAAAAALTGPDGTRPTLALTTNGIGLRHHAPGLASAGLDRVNVSLDSLDRDRFAAITHRDRLDDVLAGLAAARAAGLDPIKVNAVLLPGVNDDEAVPLLRWALEHGYELRFIEQMPLDAQGAWERSAMVTADAILAQLAGAFYLDPEPASQRGSAPAQTWYVGAAGPSGRRPRVGVIASVTRPFCGDCDRTRLTADGQLRTCLFAQRETDLRALVRSGADDAQIAAAWRSAMWGKRAGHGIDDPSFLQPERPMSAIGG